MTHDKRYWISSPVDDDVGRQTENSCVAPWNTRCLIGKQLRIFSTEKPWFRVKNSCTVNVNSDRISTKCLHRRQLESVPLPSKTTLHGFYYTDSPLSFVFVKWGNAIGGYHHFFLILSTVKYLHRSQHNFICNLVMLYTLFFFGVLLLLEIEFLNELHAYPISSSHSWQIWMVMLNRRLIIHLSDDSDNQ